MKERIENLATALIIAIACLNMVGCMQLTGAKKIKWGTFEIESNAGFEVSAGAMQYDGANNNKTMNRNGRSE